MRTVFSDYYYTLAAIKGMRAHNDHKVHRTEALDKKRSVEGLGNNARSKGSNKARSKYKKATARVRANAN